MSQTTSEALPTTSEGSIAKGLYFVFPLGTRTITAWGSPTTGRERVFVDNVVISEGRNMRKESVHRVRIDDQEYAVAFRIISITKGPMECRLIKNGATLHGYTATVLPAKPLSTAQRLAIAAIGAGTIIATAVFNAPVWAVVMLVLVGILVLAATRAKVLFSIEDAPRS